MKKELFGKTENGKEIYAYTLQSGNLSARILTYGAILQSYSVCGLDVVMGFDSYEGYRDGGGSHGAIIGRYANRIENGTFTLNGKTYELEKNEKGITHIHGGKNGFSRRVWDACEKEGKDFESLVLTLHSPNGDGNYPGNLDVRVTYTLSWQGLAIHYEADCDADTILNLTNHAYFNCNGYQGGSIYDHVLQIHSERFAAIDDRSIPYEIRAVKGTPFDFTAPRTIGARIDDDYDQLKMGTGYDHHFYLDDAPEKTLYGRALKCAAIASAEKARLVCYTDQEGVQLYTANFMDHDVLFKGGLKQTPRHAFCLETQQVANSPNHGSAILRAGQHYDTMTVYTLELL